MIETIICNYLTQKLGVPVKPEKPAQPYDKMVFVERTGGRGKWIKQTTVALQSYAASMYEAAKLNDEVIDAMLDIIELDEIIKIDLNQNYNFTDTTTKQYRYQAVFDISHY